MQVTQSQISTFYNDGFAVLEEALSDDDLRPVIDEYSELIESRAAASVAAGRVRDAYSAEGFSRRLAKLAAQDAEIAAKLDIMQARGEATFDFLRNAAVLDVAEAFVGSEVLCSPIQHIRATGPTGPEGQGQTPWHQDAGVCWPEADGGFILTIWIPLVDATLENGCLEVLPGSHHAGMCTHTMTPYGLDILEEHRPDIEPVALPVTVGSIVLFHNYTVHHARSNRSDGIRWSFDLRYQDAYQPTGRPMYPAFLFRSRLRPDAVFTDHKTWADRWEYALDSTVGARHYRW